MAGRWTRRNLLTTTGTAVAGTSLGVTSRAGTATAQNADPRDEAAAIVDRIRPPRFPDHDVLITDHGAVGDGRTLCTDAIAAAIDDCAAAGGGRVVVPPGTFLTGAVHLKSRVNLHLDEGSRLAFSQDPADYLPVVFTRYEGVELYNYSPFVYAYDQHDIAVTGAGVLDGQAGDAHWWPWKEIERDDRAALFDLAEDDVPVSERVFGDGHVIRPNFVQPYRCRNVLIEGVTVVNAPMWQIHPVLCENVTVRGVTVDSHGPNNDGCNPESCTDVLIQGCYFDTGDDCIAIKSGRNADGRRLDTPCENIVIDRCEMKDGHGGVVIGSEMTGGVRNVFARHCRLSSPNLDRVLRIKTNSVRGGFVENVHLKHLRVGTVAWSGVQVNFFYEEGYGGDYLPTVRNITVENMRTPTGCTFALYLRGYEESPIRDVALRNCVFTDVSGEPEQGRGPIRLENAENVVLRNVEVNGRRYDTVLEG